MGGTIHPQVLMSIWNDLCLKYCPKFSRPHVRLKLFQQFSLFAEREQIDPVAYMEWYLGTEESKQYAPTPAPLLNPEKVARYRMMKV